MVYAREREGWEGNASGQRDRERARARKKEREREWSAFSLATTLFFFSGSARATPLPVSSPWPGARRGKSRRNGAACRVVSRRYLCRRCLVVAAAATPTPKVARRARARITPYYVYDQRASSWHFGSTLFRGREGGGATLRRCSSSSSFVPRGWGRAKVERSMAAAAAAVTPATSATSASPWLVEASSATRWLAPPPRSLARSDVGGRACGGMKGAGVRGQGESGGAKEWGMHREKGG